MSDTEKLIQLMKEVLTVDAGYNGEYIETEINYEEVAEHLIAAGLGLQKHGRWVPGYDNADPWTCSECGFGSVAMDDYGTPYDFGIDYCEKCGAKMDLDVKEKESDHDSSRANPGSRI